MTLQFVGGSKVDNDGSSVTVDAVGFVRLDGMGVCERVARDGKVYLRFKDFDRMRSQCRGTRLIEIPLDVFLEKLAAKRDENG